MFAHPVHVASLLRDVDITLNDLNMFGTLIDIISYYELLKVAHY